MAQFDPRRNGVVYAELVDLLDPHYGSLKLHRSFALLQSSMSSQPEAVTAARALAENLRAAVALADEIADLNEGS